MDEAMTQGEIYKEALDRGKRYAQKEAIANMVKEYGEEQIREWIIEIMKEGKDNGK